MMSQYIVLQFHNGTMSLQSDTIELLSRAQSGNKQNRMHACCAYTTTILTMIFAKDHRKGVRTERPSPGFKRHWPFRTRLKQPPSFKRSLGISVMYCPPDIYSIWHNI